MTLHERASTGFNAAASAYQLGRPEYPAELLAILGQEVPIGPGARLVDVGSGTGKFAALLLESGAHVFAAEPVPSMLAELTGTLPAVHAVNAEAHGLPFASASVDLLSAATAFHWFADDEAILEFARVLRPGGAFAVVSQRRGVDDPIGGALEQVLAKRRPAPEGSGPRPDDLFGRSGLFGPPREAVVPHVHQLSREEVLHLALSMSYIASDPVVRAEVTEEVEAFLPESGTIPIQYRALVSLYRRTA